MAEDLVPTGLPYGERQRVVQQMQQANVPLQSVPQNSDGGGQQTQLPPRAMPAPPPDLSQFDVFANRQPSPMDAAPPVNPTASTLAMMEQSDNEVMRSIADRMRRIRGG